MVMQRYPYLAQYNDTSVYEGVVLFVTGPHQGIVLYVPTDLTPGDARAELTLFEQLSPPFNEIDDYDGSVILRTSADPALGS